MKHLPDRAPSVLEYFATLVADDAHFPLLEAAIAIGQDEYPDMAPQSVMDAVDALAARLKRRLPPDASALQRLRTLNHFFFREMGFAGNVNDYHDIRNSHLNEVLITRRGIPITLALLLCELASHIGLTARGVSFPGHFLVKVKMPQGEVFLDPFDGHSLSRDDLEERLAPYRKRHGLEGDFEVPLGLFLQAAAPREVLTRMLHNLKEIHRATQDWRRWLSVQERLVVLLPGVPEEVRDRGLALAELGRIQEAALDLEAYLAQRPTADDAPALAQRLSVLRRLRSPRLH